LPHPGGRRRGRDDVLEGHVDRFQLEALKKELGHEDSSSMTRPEVEA
jgi:hypothetical protein